VSVVVSMEELLGWSDEASNFWKLHFDANPALLELKCGIGGAATVQDLVRHIWAVDLRWAQRLAGLPETPVADFPAGPLEALFDLHQRAAQILKGLIADPQQDWDAPYTLKASWLPQGEATLSRRKVMGHALFHGQRHWAQLATLLREAGSPTGFRGDFLFCSSLK